MKVRWKDLIYIMLGLVLIAALLIRADVSSTLGHMGDIDLGLLLLVLVLYVFNITTKTLRWQAILKGMGLKRNRLVTVPIFLSSLALNNSTPGKVGGEPVRAYLLREHTGVRLSTGVASIFAEKVLDILTILVLSVLGMGYLLYELGIGELTGLLVVLSVGSALMVTAIALMTRRGFTLWVIRLFLTMISRVPMRFVRSRGRKLLLRFEDSSERFHDSLSRLMRSRFTAASVLLMTCAIWLNEALRIYIIVMALPGDMHVSFPGAIAAAALANVLGFLLPIGSGNIVGSTSVLVLLTGKETASTAASLTAVATSLWLSIPLGLVSLAILRRRSSRLKRDPNAGKAPLGGERGQ